MPRPSRSATILATSATGLFVLVGLQIVAGIVLGLSYRPTLEDAHASVEALRAGGFGRVLVAFHYWGSAVLTVHAFLHLAAMLWLGWYRPPNQWRWIGTVTLFLTALLFHITGNLLPLDQHDVRTVVVELGIAGQVPIVGPGVAEVLRQGTEFGQPTLSGWYFAHRWLLPILLVVGTFGSFVSHFRLRDSEVRPLWAVLPATVAALVALFLPGPSGSAAKAVDFASFDAVPSFYTLPLHGSLTLFAKISPSLGWIGAVLLPTLFAGFLLSLPWASRVLTPLVIRTVFVVHVGFFAVASLLAGSAIAPLSGSQDRMAAEPAAPTASLPPAVDAALAARGRTLFNDNACSGCHGEDGLEAGGGPKLDRFWTKGRDREWTIRFIEEPEKMKPGSTMPGFKGELKPEELKAIAEFLLQPRP